MLVCLVTTGTMFFFFIIISLTKEIKKKSIRIPDMLHCMLSNGLLFLLNPNLGYLAKFVNLGQPASEEPC